MNLLAVSLAFPPLAYPRSIQVARLLRHVDATTALFCADEPGARLDPTIEPDAAARLKACERVPVRKTAISKMIDKLAFRFSPPLWNRRNLVPDQYGSWKNFVVARVADYVRKNDFRPDAIVSFAQPFTDHLIGLELRSRFGVPWLAHFSDPWADNPFAAFDERSRAKNLEMERSVAEKADILIFTSQETIDLFYGKYPAQLKKKARVLPQCYDPAAFADRVGRDQGAIVIRYLGNFYGRRSPQPLISALLRLQAESPRTLENVLFELVGSGDADEVKGLSQSLPSGLLAVRPSVSYRESLDLMRDSDGLLIIDAPAKQSVFLPSKLIDYIGAARPIFGVTPPGAAASLIRELGGTVADPADTIPVAGQLSRFIGSLKERRAASVYETWGNAAVRGRYTARTVSDNFSGMLNELVRGR